MYQVTLFDADGAIVQVEHFSSHQDALRWMIDYALHRRKGATSWQLSQRTRKGGLVPHQSVVRR